MYGTCFVLTQCFLTWPDLLIRKILIIPGVDLSVSHVNCVWHLVNFFFLKMRELNNRKYSL